MSTTAHTRSPLRLLAAFVAQKVKQLTALRDEGGLFECRFLSRLIERIRTGITGAHTESVQIQDGVADLRQFLLRETGPADDTPGVLDPLESEVFLQKVAHLGTTARHHTGQLEQLT